MDSIPEHNAGWIYHKQTVELKDDPGAIKGHFAL